MTEVALNVVSSAVSTTEAEPLELAMDMEQARRDLLLILLAEDDAATLLLKQCLSQLNNGPDISEIVSDKTVNAIIVQAANFVQPNLGQTVQYLLDNPADRSSLRNLHFLPSFLIEVAHLFISMTRHRRAFSEYRLELGQAAQTLQRLRQQMIATNVRLVAFVAHKHKTTTLSFDDLLQEGVIGLIKAIDRFDPYRGYRFSTYAVPWIKQAISRLIVKQEKIVRLPVSLAEKASGVFEAMRSAYMQTERWPSVEQLKTLCDLSEDEIKIIRSYYQATHSLDEESDEGLELMSRMKQQQFALPLDELIGRNLGQYLDQVVGTLPEKEATILNMRFGLKNHTEMTLQAIAEQLQVSRERVRQIQNEALKKLKNQFGFELMLFLEHNDSY
ncbi:sigma-70 family RNA polymerase sigma factor [Candidatus Methylobacter oryzae]|uniref:Sigma-70 family RNA polymerase sigma factor n=1 Tax=Candidatus Methylobacter oryzae TaxID=2497749 RepID=A0ABY3CBZ2_9GAMM|nr:RNA polymerase sigma factor RpoD/SigA [Candidatus Methylobacter oryzae]TRW97087.1 sigma-70 family RNA polymerase sigma factor [Candidatus Methylobacter oryzae]